MELLKERIRKEGKVVGSDGILKVDGFLNHQMDTALLRAIGEEVRARFEGVQVDRIVTIESSGIGIACFVAQACGDIPMVFAKKTRTRNISGDIYIGQVESFTQDRRPYNIFVSRDFIRPGEKVLIVDDFLAHGSAMSALIDIVQQAGAEVAGVAVVIEKTFQKGREIVRGKGVRVESLARISSMSEEDGVTFI